MKSTCPTCPIYYTCKSKATISATAICYSRPASRMHPRKVETTDNPVARMYRQEQAIRAGTIEYKG